MVVREAVALERNKGEGEFLIKQCPAIYLITHYCQKVRAPLVTSVSVTVS